MNEKFNNRKEKLIFLNQVMKKQRSIVELRTPKHPFLVGNMKEPGVYKELETGVFWTPEDVKEYENKYPGDRVFLWWFGDSWGTHLEILFQKISRGEIIL